jgi:DNA-binding NarL/FixJ family response regulator
MLSGSISRSKVARIYRSLITGEVTPDVLSGLVTHTKPTDYALISAKSRSLLTRSERQIVIGLFLGLSAKEMAIARNSSNRTVEAHVASIKIKMGGERLSGLILSALFEDCLAAGFS